METGLVLKARNGDADAFAALYSQFSSDLYRFAFYMLGNREDARDSVQDACLLAFANISSLQKAGAFKSWLFKILSNCCKAKLTRAAEKGAPLPLDDFYELIPDENSAGFILSLELREAVFSLSEEERNIVLLSVVGGYKSHEISEILGLGASTVRSKLSRSLTKLRVILSDKGVATT